MKIPEPAPSAHLSAEFAVNLPTNAALLGDVISKAQAGYLYWDRFKQLPMPKGIKASDAWGYVRLLRRLNSQVTAIPADGGGHFSYSITANVMRALHNIDTWGAGWEIGPSDAAPGDDVWERYVISSLLEESIASSQIEGASTTRKRAKEMLLNATKPRNRGDRMIVNNYTTMKMIAGLKDEPITPQLLLDLQASMTTGTLDHPEDVGVFRTGDDVVVTDEQNQVLYTPPPAAQVPAMVDALCEYANRTDGEFEHPAIKAIALHFWLAIIHPFADGNGRTARALFYLYMLKHGYWLFEYLSISRVILRRRAQYERAYLYAETDDSDFTYFLQFHLEAIETALEETRRYIEIKAAEEHTVQTLVQSDFDLNHRQRAVLSRALKKSSAVFTIQSHATSHGVVRATARADLLELVDRGLLVSRREGRQIVFAAAPDLRDRLRGRKA
ncbi:MAG: Fic family protein [Coriobacteriia bacterium]